MDKAVNPLIGTFQAKIEMSDFTQLEEGLRGALCALDEWGAPMDPVPISLTTIFDQIEDRRDAGSLFKPYDPLINAELRCPIINRMDRHAGIPDGGFEPTLSRGLGNIAAYGNSPLRNLAS